MATPPKKGQNPTKGFYCCFSTKKNIFVFFRILLQFLFFTTTVLSSGHCYYKNSEKTFFLTRFSILKTLLTLKCNPQIKTDKTQIKGFTAFFHEIKKFFFWLKNSSKTLQWDFPPFLGGWSCVFWSPKSPKMLNIVKNIFFHYI